MVHLCSDGLNDVPSHFLSHLFPQRISFATADQSSDCTSSFRCFRRRRLVQLLVVALITGRGSAAVVLLVTGIAASRVKGTVRTRVPVCPAPGQPVGQKVSADGSRVADDCNSRHFRQMEHKYNNTKITINCVNSLCVRPPLTEPEKRERVEEA